MPYRALHGHRCQPAHRAQRPPGHGVAEVVEQDQVVLDRLPGDLTRQLQVDDPAIPPTEQRVYIRANRDVRYGEFMAVMNTLQGNGFYQVALINEEL